MKESQKAYEQYLHWSNLIMTTVIPLTILTACNVGIFAVYKSSGKNLAVGSVPDCSSHGEGSILNRHQHHHHSSNQKVCHFRTRQQRRGLDNPGEEPELAPTPGSRRSFCFRWHSSFRSNHPNGAAAAARPLPLNTSGARSSEASLAAILAAIVLVFFVCHSCRFFLAFYFVSVSEDTEQCIENGLQSQQQQQQQQNSWLYPISAISHTLLIVNSSINFIIYCAVGSRFRRTLICHARSVCGHEEARERPKTIAIPLLPLISQQPINLRPQTALGSRRRESACHDDQVSVDRLGNTDRGRSNFTLAPPVSAEVRRPSVSRGSNGQPATRSLDILPEQWIEAVADRDRPEFRISTIAQVEISHFSQ